MESLPIVSVIMPAHRIEDMASAIDIFNTQDYPAKELIIIPTGWELMHAVPLQHNIFAGASKVFDKLTIGAKRNYGCDMAKGKIVIHQDTDDLYDPDWISKSVEALLSSGAEITGLRNAYFAKNGSKYLYENRTRYQNVLLGATLCYRKSFWQKHPFQDKSIGEDKDFCLSASKVFAHDYIDGFTATLHDNNTSSHNAFHSMKLVK